ncbi:hypothetical protein BGZ65_004689 [Modicella reniformis]|uniref:Uncharacterized protein n=1 Tax=Modicella reniformis TaxID=1440133 RepID=A0A9P6M8U0_9FUNG|nr:hypothetical protein BGZ65_004689 [Modicella reniformis]
MEQLPEHKQVFLNELHEELKSLDPRRTPIAGLYRILGRLVEYDIYTQIAKIESCFHHDYIHPPASLQNTPEKERPLIRVESESDHDTVIDLTQDSGDEDDDDHQNQDRDSISILPSHSLISTPHQLPLDNSLSSLQQQRRRQQDGSVTVVGVPRVILLIDTNLLEPWGYERGSLCQFIGEVMYENRRWILQARTWRNMDGLDLLLSDSLSCALGNYKPNTPDTAPSVDIC